MPLGIKQTVPFLTVANTDVSLRFYLDGLGFSIVHEWRPRGRIEWCMIRRDEGFLMMQEPAPDYTGTLPEPRGQGVVVIFLCEDALVLYHEALERNIPVSEPFVGNNLWVVSFTDPDGYRIDFESETDVPEETTYTEWLASRNSTL
ncbi:MAG: VOC family protein [Siphonobacter aquaeclarae]|nr:VOC family protein [Siphonobacter aquaeclarae]